jgi:hypothetical protein
MIQANELRIGNWVKVGDTESTVCLIDHQFILLQGNAVINRPEQIEPIPLTPEILEKCGFEWSIYHQGFYKKDFVNILGEYQYGYRFKIFRTSQYVGTKINYLHQLQNLVFILTGEELTINF